MGRELQKRKRRSARATVRPIVKKKVLNPLGNDTVAKNWYVLLFLLLSLHLSLCTYVCVCAEKDTGTVRLIAS